LIDGISVGGGSYSHEVLGVASGDISTVKGVAVGNISKVLGV